MGYSLCRIQGEKLKNILLENPLLITISSDASCVRECFVLTESSTFRERRSQSVNSATLQLSSNHTVVRLLLPEENEVTTEPVLRPLSLDYFMRILSINRTPLDSAMTVVKSGDTRITSFISPQGE
jgi:hypothetical protein